MPIGNPVVTEKQKRADNLSLEHTQSFFRKPAEYEDFHEKA